jgi:acyl-[acyl-carrier-protein] desaturase
MECLEQLAPPRLEAAFYRLYRDFFNRAEKKRRWSLQDDIPWGQVNPSLDPAVGDVVESFCAVELFLPDYVASGMALFRPSRACTWFYANWGYEESKHSLALGDWLLRSGMRTDEQMADLEGRVLGQQWDLPHDSPVAMLIYAMVQELATGLTYRNLRRQVGAGADRPWTGCWGSSGSMNNPITTSSSRPCGCTCGMTGRGRCANWPGC